MKYRTNRRTGDRISEIGLGSSNLYGAGTEEAVKALRRAKENGVNYFDMGAGHGAAFPIYGEALKDVRQEILYQVHFGADYTKGDYGWTLDLETVKRSVDKMLTELRTDYIDYGFIHCQDDIPDWETYLKNGIYDYILQLKAEGVVRHTGLSSHTPKAIQRILDDAEIDMLMFSVNPAYDYGEGEYAYGEEDERSAVYRRCEKEGIGISVMKPFSGGQLLDDKASPFKKALTIYQCMKYALDRPGVLTVLPGVRDLSEIDTLFAYYDQSEEALDYSAISAFEKAKVSGKCVYCNHCRPCPAGIDIGLVNKYYDLALAGDGMAADHYRKLEKNAADCIQCGHCDSRCPFSVRQSERMQEIRAYMERR